MFANANHDSLRTKGSRGFVFRMVAVMLTVVLVLCSNPFITNVYGEVVTQGKVTAKSGNVRSNPSTSAAVVFCVKSDDDVAILGQEKGSDNNTWYKIAVGTSVGYIRSDLVSKTDKKITVDSTLVAGEKSQEASVTDKDKKEDKVSEAEKTEKTEKTDTDTSGNTSLQAGGRVGTINASSVRMRNGASTSSGVVGYLEKGSTVTILNEGKASDGQIWYQIKNNDSIGFVRGDFVTTAQEESAKTEDTTEIKPKDQETGDVSEETVKEEKPKAETTIEIEPGECVVKGTSVRIRKEADTASDIITTVNTDRKLSVLGKASGSGMEWIKVSVQVGENTETGYICDKFVQVTREAKETEVVSQQEETDKKDTEQTDASTTEQEIKEGETPSTDDQKIHASIKGTGVRVREVPVDGNIVCQLSNGHPITITDAAQGSDGIRWFKIDFPYMGSDKTGYVRQDFIANVEMIEAQAPVGDETFEASIASFPDSYKNSLRTIHEKHPNWVFEAVNTGLDWNEALKAETSVGKNLVSKNSIASWKSTAAQAYNWSTNTWYTFDGGSWVSASGELIAYYMDPRNFLNDSGIYQFENLDYNDRQTAENTAKMLTGTFMSNDFTDTDGTVAKYADVFLTAGKTVGVSPYLLAGRCLQEQGINGDSQSIAGNVPGHEGVFNYFNVGAYAYGGRSATINGLIYAKGSDEASLRPWNSRIKSIYGGAKYIAEQYVSKGQNTLYFQKFNVINSENTIYSHQYMSNIQAASSESARLQLAYLGGDEELHFRIPFYNNMPENKCEKPVSDSSPNTYLATLSVEGAQLSPAFSGVMEKYTVNVGADVENITISAKAVSDNSSVGGTGTFSVKSGSNVFYVVCKAQNGSSKTYTITVQK